MKFKGNLAKEWEKLNQRFLKRLVGEWRVSTYSKAGRLHSRGKALLVLKKGRLVVEAGISMKMVEMGQISHTLFRRKGEFFSVFASECIYSLNPYMKNGDSYKFDFSISMSGI